MVELIGRQREMREVIDRLSHRRLVTIIGPGGIGKTSVARAVADVTAGDFELGAHIVDLTRVEEPAAVGAAIAGQLGFPSFEALLGSLSCQPALVVVDNCEHVIGAAAEVVSTLLGACETPTVLATSRSPLDVPGESLVVLGPLSVLAPGTTETAPDAVRLFLERAYDAGAAIGDDQVEDVVRLCRHLDGVPLAIELAAARTRTMQPGEILTRLRTGLDVLARPRARGDPRHRSVAATIEWSHRLLPEPTARLFERLGLLAGPFTAELAEAVGADVGMAPHDAAEALQLLVDSSLVVAEPAGDITCFRLLETVRAFAVGRLAEQGALDEARNRIADHVVAAAEAILVEGHRRWDVFPRLVPLYADLASTLRWCLTHDADSTRSLLLCAVLWALVHQGYTDEIHELCEQTLERWPDPSAVLAADAWATAAVARCLVGDPDGGLALARQALAEAPASATSPVTLRRAIGWAARALEDRPLAREMFTATAGEARERGLLAWALEADVLAAMVIAEGGDLDVATELAARARIEAAAAALRINEIFAQSIAANLRLRRDLDRGLAEVATALDAATRMGYLAAVGVNLRSLVWGLTRTGRYEEAARAVAELIDGLLARGFADRRGVLWSAADLLHELDRAAWAELAATAEEMPIVGPTSAALDAIVQLPSPDAVPLSHRDAVAVARREIRSFLAGSSAPPCPPVAVPASAGRIVHRGDFWELTFAGRTITVKATKGIADIARLLTSSGRDVHCFELIGGAVEQPSTGELLDQRARRDYEQRIRDLQAEVDDAEADHDRGRADRARVELDTLVDHLTAALGLRGRSRRGGGSAERARSAVTQRIRSTIRRIAAAHPQLGRHLEASITTGTYCSYRPEHPVDWQA